jgi:5-methyltetrahydropteroyltriglutamate--homocysteine methyltransferase
MESIVYDDVGSFPLPEYIEQNKFDQFYWVAYNGLINNISIFDHKGIYNYFIHPFLHSFQLKLNAGVEIINYPQLMDMYSQFLVPIEKYEEEPHLIQPKKAIMPELIVLDHFAKDYYDRMNKPIEIKVCITGPIELYIKKVGFTIYEDLALNFAKSINSFLKNSIKNTQYQKISIIAIDEPSFGYIDIFNIEDDDLITIFDKSLEGLNIMSQIHLHTLDKYSIPLKAKNISALTCEYASNNKNVIPKKELESYDKFMRVGITRTNINSIMAERLDMGATYDELRSFEGVMNLIDSKERIKKNLNDAMKHYGDRLKFVGPDCGLKGWHPPAVAYEVLKRTYEVIKEVKNERV